MNTAANPPLLFSPLHGLLYTPRSCLVLNKSIVRKLLARIGFFSTYYTLPQEPVQITSYLQPSYGQKNFKKFKLNGHYRKKSRNFFQIFFLQNFFPSPYLSRAVCPVKISHKLQILEKFGTSYCTVYSGSTSGNEAIMFRCVRNLIAFKYYGSGSCLNMTYIEQFQIFFLDDFNSLLKQRILPS